MNLLDSILGNDSNQVVAELAKQLGVGENDARTAARQLIPSLARGLQNNAKSDNGLDNLIGALSKGNHSKYLDSPSSLGQSATTQEGNAILGHIFGNKDVSRNIANHGAQKSGLSSMLLKKALPILATLVMSSLSKKFLGGGNKSSGGGIFEGNRNNDIFSSGVSANKNRGLLATFLDADKDGSVIDDLLSMAVKVALR
ncbi:hypothetical protein AB833_18480 [Chromatiales bacterium (ex Bugula neritina AB1)]|nr:hypothetical protein AB833_18480 [Chromatiales bacterium (ex Bugula neritina AB1)]